MKKGNVNYHESQELRLSVKNLREQMKNIAVQGAGISPWEAEVLVNMIEDVYFSELMMREIIPGQIKYQCISAEEGAGKALALCKMVTVTLTLLDHTDRGDFSTDNKKDRSIELRRRRLGRLADEAKDQGGLLSQEDLAELLMCDPRTIRRDIIALKKIGVIVPTRGQQQDIGPGVSHRAVAIKLWLEGKEPVAIAKWIKHSIKAVDIYLQKFKRVAFLRGKDFSEFEIALTVGISVSATKTILEIYDEFRGKAFFDQRLEEIKLVGERYWQAQDEKKSMALSTQKSRNWRKQ